jgi:hypothetical protein
LETKIVDPPEGVNRLGHDGVERSLITHVSGPRERRSARGLDQRRRLGELVGCPLAVREPWLLASEVDDDHVSALLGAAWLHAPGPCPVPRR